MASKSIKKGQQGLGQIIESFQVMLQGRGDNGPSRSMSDTSPSREMGKTDLKQAAAGDSTGLS